MGTLQLGPRRLNYEDVGSGLPILLIHGFTNYGMSWAPQLAALVHSGHRVILPDLYGHGASSPAAEICTVPDLACDMLKLLDHLGVGSICLRSITRRHGCIANGRRSAKPNLGHYSGQQPVMVYRARGLGDGGCVDRLAFAERRSVEAPALHLADVGQRRIPRERSRPGIVRRLGACFVDRSRLFTLPSR